MTSTLSAVINEIVHSVFKKRQARDKARYSRLAYSQLEWREHLILQPQASHSPPRPPLDPPLET